MSHPFTCPHPSHTLPLVDSFPLPLKFPSHLILPHPAADHMWVIHSCRPTPPVCASLIAVKPTVMHNPCDTAGHLVWDSCCTGLAFYCVYNHSGLLPYIPLFSFCLKTTALHIPYIYITLLAWPWPSRQECSPTFPSSFRLHAFASNTSYAHYEFPSRAVGATSAHHGLHLCMRQDGSV